MELFKIIPYETKGMKWNFDNSFNGLELLTKDFYIMFVHDVYLQIKLVYQHHKSYAGKYCYQCQNMYFLAVSPLQNDTDKIEW